MASKAASLLTKPPFALADVVLIVAALPVIGELLLLALVVITLLFLTPFLHCHVVAYCASSDGAEEPMMHHMAVQTAYGGSRPHRPVEAARLRLPE